MGDYDRYKHGDTIEMGMGGERLSPHRTATTSRSATDSTKDYKIDPFATPTGLHADGELDTDYKPVNWKKVIFTPKYLVLWIILILVGIATAVISLKHDQVVEALKPFAEKVRDIPAGWLIFVAILFVISFPPLFGHELVALLAGVVYGLWIGFGVVAAGTFVGEIGTWFAFKKVFRKKAEKMERTNLTYGAMAKLCRDGGFWIVFVIRLSIIPSHMSTAVFSTCDVKFWHFAVSTFFTLPKQLILVYLGVLLIGGQSDFWIKFGLFGVAGGITVVSGIWIWYKMAAIKKELIARQERRRAEKETRDQQQQAAAAVPESTPLGRSNSYNNMATEQPAAMYYGGHPIATEMTSGGNGGYQAYSPTQQQSAAGYGYAQSTPFPEDNNAGDLGTYQSYPQQQYPQSHDSPEQRKPVNPYPFV